MNSGVISLGELTIGIRSKSESLEGAKIASGSLQGLKAAKNKIDDAYMRLAVKVGALDSLSRFLNVEVEIDWKDLNGKLIRTRKWMESGLVDGDATHLTNLNESLRNMASDVDSKLNELWGIISPRIQRARTLLEFIDLNRSLELLRASNRFTSVVTPQAMVDSLEFVNDAEDFIAQQGVGNASVQTFLEASSTRQGASLDSIDDLDVLAWLNQGGRREKFSITFKDKGQ
jgi:hypothetical protein